MKFAHGSTQSSPSCLILATSRRCPLKPISRRWRVSCLRRTTCWYRLWNRRRRAESAVPRRSRVDVELVRRGLARSRQQAAELIGAGKVSIDGMPAVKPATAVAATAALTVAADDERRWVSRGAHKLIGALDAFGIAVAGRRCLDAGASTGGFTEVLLDRGAAEVVGADAGYGQLAWSLGSARGVIV